MEEEKQLSIIVNNLQEHVLMYKRLVLQVYLHLNTLEFRYVGKSFASRLYENKVHCYVATRPEVEGFGSQGFVGTICSAFLAHVDQVWIGTPDTWNGHWHLLGRDPSNT